MLKCFCEEPMTLEPEAEHWYATSCGHVFHYLCLINWLERSKTCPQCRKPVGRAQMFRLYPTPYEEKPKDNINETLQTCLDTSQLELEEMMKLCKKKDEVISSLKVGADNNDNFRQENEALKSILQTFGRDAMDALFDDPKNFDEVLKGKMALIKLDERVEQNNPQASENEGAAQITTETHNSNAVRSRVDAENEDIESSLGNLNHMLTRLS